MADLFPGAKLIETAGFTARKAPDPNLAWSVVHTTANATLSAEGHAWAQPIGTGQVTATFWVNRDGSVVQSLPNPRLQAPWTNGAPNRPNLANPRIAACIAAKVNPNLRSLVTIENVSLEPADPITPAQEQTNAAIIRWAHALAGVPISRQTVIGHYEINSVDRPNCPARNKSVIDRIVALAAGGAADDMTITTIKGEDWLPTTNATGASNGVLRATPDKAAAIVARLPLGTSVRSIAEVTTPGPSADNNWRLTEHAGQVVYMLRRDWAPQVAGGDPAVDAQLTAYIAGQSSAGYTQAELDEAVSKAQTNAATSVAAAAVTEAKAYT